MTEREMLACAAEAAGYKINVNLMEQRKIAAPEAVALALSEPGSTWWNPLEDDGDALRLANKLWLEIRHLHGEVHVGLKGEFWCTEHWFPDGDQDLATRKAIVRAAVRIAQLIQQATKE